MIYLVSMYYPPVSNPGANRMSHMARVLVQRYGAGEVRVVTGRPNYPDGKMPAGFHWRLYCRRTGPWGERVDHLYELAAPFKGLFRKTLGMVTFACSLGVFLLFRRLRPGDLVYVTSGPIFSVYVIHLLSFLKPGLRYVLDIRDLWPQTVAGLGHMREDGWPYRVLKAWTDAAHRRATASVGVVEEIRDYIRAVAPDRPAHLLYNPVDTDLFKPLPEAEVAAFRGCRQDLFGNPARVVFLYSGVHSNAMDLWTLVRALEILRRRTDQFFFILIGYGEQKDGIRAFAETHDLSDCARFLDYLPRTKLLKYICAVDACYSSTSSTPIYRMVIPTKMCEYMACDKFVVAVHDCPFADKAAAAGNAVVSPPGDPEALADTLSRLIADRAWQQRQLTSRAYIVEHHSVAAFSRAVPALFDSLLTPP